MSDKENHKIMAQHIKLLDVKCPVCNEKGRMRILQYPDFRTKSMIVMLFCSNCGYPFIRRRG